MSKRKEKTNEDYPLVGLGSNGNGSGNNALNVETLLKKFTPVEKYLRKRVVTHFFDGTPTGKKAKDWFLRRFEMKIKIWTNEAPKGSEHFFVAKNHKASEVVIQLRNMKVLLGLLRFLKENQMQNWTVVECHPTQSCSEEYKGDLIIRKPEEEVDHIYEVTASIRPESNGKWSDIIKKFRKVRRRETKEFFIVGPENTDWEQKGESFEMMRGSGCLIFQVTGEVGKRARKQTKKKKTKKQVRPKKK